MHKLTSRPPSGTSNTTPAFFEDISDLPEDLEYNLLEGLFDQEGAFDDRSDPKLEAALSTYFRAYKKRIKRAKYPVRRGLRRLYEANEDEDEDEAAFDSDKDFIDDSGFEDVPGDNDDYEPPSDDPSDRSADDDDLQSGNDGNGRTERAEDGPSREASIAQESFNATHHDEASNNDPEAESSDSSESNGKSCRTFAAAVDHLLHTQSASCRPFEW